MIWKFWHPTRKSLSLHLVLSRGIALASLCRIHLALPVKQYMDMREVLNNHLTRDIYAHQARHEARLPILTRERTRLLGSRQVENTTAWVLV